MPVPDRPSDTIDIRLLRSTEWIAAVGAVEGGAIYLTLEEMGLYGTADVVEIGPCPEIPEGPGRVVLATITQDNSAIRRLQFEGNELVLAPTDRHRLYSITRAAWTPTEQLEPGEVLITREGSIRIASNERSESSARVYNLQVETEECYYVTPEYILSHNANPCATGPGANWEKTSGIIRDAAKGKGNFGLGTGTYEEAMEAGRAWGGRGIQSSQ